MRFAAQGLRLPGVALSGFLSLFVVSGRRLNTGLKSIEFIRPKEGDIERPSCVVKLYPKQQAQVRLCYALLLSALFSQAKSLELRPRRRPTLKLQHERETLEKTPLKAYTLKLRP